MFNLWSQRDLSLYSKITIAKTLGIAKMIFFSACLSTRLQFTHPIYYTVDKNSYSIRVEKYAIQN